MSDEEALKCQQLLEQHLHALATTRILAEDTPINESECTTLVDDLRTLQTDQNGEGRTQPSPTDTALRSVLFSLVSTLSITDPQFVKVWYLLDVTTILSNHSICEPAADIQLVETLLDSQTVSGCRRVFDYLESRRDLLISRNFKQKNLVILRCCNELLRRLSRAEDTVFCGRVFIFLFQSFPLGDRSSVNLRGEFHVENVTNFDPAPKRSDDAIKPMEIDGDDTATRPTSSGAQTPASVALDADASQKTGRSTPLPSKGKKETLKPGEIAAPAPDLDAFFPQFWSMQDLFCTPTKLFDPSAMTQLKTGMNNILACFKSTSTSTSASSHAPVVSKGTKRKRGSDNGARVAQPYNPKYLTSRDLFDLEIHDLAFRRHILAQCLIMLDFLLSLTPSAKAKIQGLSNKSVQYAFTLSDEDTKYCHSIRQSIASYLQQQGPGNDGKMYYRMVDTVLSRDKNWAHWKAEACPEISRPGIEADDYITTQRSLEEMVQRKPFANPPGAADFNFLSETEPVEALKYPSERYSVPSAEDYYKSIEGDKLDEDFVANEEERKELHEKINGKLWRALRASALDGRRFALCEKIKDGANLKALIGEDEEAAPTTVEGEASEAAKDAVNGHEQKDETVAEAQGDEDKAMIPQTDGTMDDAPSTAQAANEPENQDIDVGDDGAVTADEEDENEFAPPGAHDADEGDLGIGKEPAEVALQEADEPMSVTDVQVG
jgi:THO complex subunit 1